MSIEFKRYSENACVPLRQTSGSAGYDLYAVEDKIIKSCGKELVRVDLKMAIPYGYYGRTVGCSGLALKCSLLVHNGTIDLDYCVVICVILLNFSNFDYNIKKVNHIAQLIIEHYYEPKFVELLKLS